ncbi:hypothetical protein N0V95_007903, partial [Ascochyta clinopodiicola]
MDIDRDTSPSTKSDTPSSPAPSSDTTPTEHSPPISPPSIKNPQTPFISTFGLLPSTNPTTCAHIIDTTALRTTNEHSNPFQLQDAIATTLYLSSPKTPLAFLSPTVHTFKAVFKRGRSDTQLVVWRKGIEVL